jgi:hypothetical protein
LTFHAWKLPADASDFAIFRRKRPIFPNFGHSGRAKLPTRRPRLRDEKT